MDFIKKFFNENDARNKNCLIYPRNVYCTPQGHWVLSFEFNL